MKTIYLIGFMGSGKSTIGLALAKRLTKTYVDTDQLIVETKKQEIAEIFQIDGESVFRDYEIKALKDGSTYDVVSTGGGIIEKSENIQTMQKNGLIIYLHASFKEISNRLERDQTRPLWNNNIEDKLNLYNRRIQLYKKYADRIIETDGKLVSEIVQEIEEYIINE